MKDILRDWRAVRVGAAGKLAATIVP